MLGAIIGDIIGSVYEQNNIKTKSFPLYSKKSQFTDDTVMTIAIAEGLMHGGKSEDFINALKKYDRTYPNAGYGESFYKWLHSEKSEPYNSWGNGSAMRVSPVGWIYYTIEETERYAALSAVVTHNHPEGVKGAQATASAVFLARTGKSKDEIKAYISNRFGYDLYRTLDDIRPNYSFDLSCQGTVPEALIAFFESADFEDAIRNAISLGGDSDTLAAITGSIAEAAYGIPNEIKTKSLSYLPESLLNVINEFYSMFILKQKNEQEELDKIIHDCINIFCEMKEIPWMSTTPEKEEDRDPKRIYLSYPIYPQELMQLLRLSFLFGDDRDSYTNLNDKNINDLTEYEICSYFCHLSIGERFCDGLIAKCISNGKFLQMLLRLKELRSK